MPSGLKIIHKYFPDLSTKQIQQFSLLDELYKDWNAKINVISRKDIGHLYEHHVLHSLALSKIIRFKPGTCILDAGTGGGFPGIPLAVLFPDAQFHLVDSIGKKINVVKEVASAIGLSNITARHIRMENVSGKFDFAVSRAVTELQQLKKWLGDKISKENKNEQANGIFCYKGGNLQDEMKGINLNKTRIYELGDFFEEEFFQTKRIVYLY